MVNTQGLAVGLAVGIPSFIILVVVGIFWYRNQQKQKHEDMNDNEIDIGLRDDHSFNQFQEELHKQYEKNNDDDETHIREEKLTHDSSENSNDGQQHSTSTASRQTPTPHSQHYNSNHGGQRPQTSYDFYETFIPILPSNQQRSPSVQGSTADIADTHPNDTDTDLETTTNNNNGTGNNLATDSSSSLINSHLRTSSNDLNTLAKQLNNPVFFEKLPSRATKYQVKSVNNNYGNTNAVGKNNNSSSDLINNYLIGETHAINDHFTYEAPKVEVTNLNRPEEKK